MAAVGAREEILERVRDNLRKSEPFESLYPHLGPSTDANPPAKVVIHEGELASRFQAELEGVGGECHFAASQKEGAAKILEVLEGIEAATIAVSDDPTVNQCVGALERIEVLRDPSREDLFDRVGAGVTAAQLAIAETGTLVLRSSSERNRLISLVPPVHICLLAASSLRPTMFDVLDKLKDSVDAAVTFVTGPSRTSDIELTLAIGVHGPKRLIVILIDHV